MNPKSLISEAPASQTIERAFRPIHYLGSKLRLVAQIRQTLDELDPSNGRVVDLFSGSGTVSAALGISRPVTAVDIQEFSRVLCSAILRPQLLSHEVSTVFLKHVEGLEVNEALTWAVAPMLQFESHCMSEASAGQHEELSELIQAGALLSYQDSRNVRGGADLRNAFTSTVDRLTRSNLAAGPASVITRFYGGVYFSFTQALEFDRILNAARLVPEEVRDVVSAAVVSTASEVVNSVGKQFAQPINLRTRGGHAKPHLIAKVLRDRSLSVLDAFKRWIARYGSLQMPALGHQALRQDYGDFLASSRESICAIYADPPYTRDHYSRFYHVLETICLRDEPAVSRSNLGGGGLPSRGMYRAIRHQSPFSIKSQAAKAFEILFARARAFNVPLVVSYSPFDKEGGAHPRLMSIDAIVALANRKYDHVKVTSVGLFSHSKLNATRHALRASDEAEVLVICQP